MFCAVQKPCLLILANLQSNKRLKKETLRFSHTGFEPMTSALPVQCSTN